MVLSRFINRFLIATLGILVFQSGCFWQKDEYTQNMKASLQGSAAKTFGIVKMWTPQGFVLEQPPNAYQGFIRGDNPPVEVLVLGSTTEEAMPQFQNTSIKLLGDVGYGPSTPLTRGEPKTYGRSYEVYQVEELRRVGETNVDYFWYIYFTSDGPNRAMFAFLIPKEKYDTYGELMIRMLSSVKFEAAPAQQ